MFFGLTNSPATFQTMMNDIFKDLIDEGYAAVYMDNILVYTLLRAVPESTGPGVRVGRVRSSGGRGFSERVTAPTRLSCLGFSRSKRVDARGDGE